MAIKHNAKRNARLRKKLRTDEFQELGFDVFWTFNADASETQIDEIVDQFLNEVIEPQQLGFSGSGHRAWEGLICTRDIGKCTEAHRESIVEFFKGKPVSDVKTTELYDLWWG